MEGEENLDYSTRYNPKEIEDKITAFWIERGYFFANPNPNKKPFCIVIPPPNITGILHMGHALNNTIQDTLIRSKRMQGYESLWLPGTDHAGIATQNVVEKQLAKEGLRKEDIGREEFTERLWEWTKKYGSTIIEQLKKLGASCDWRRLRFTMDEDYSKAVREVFVRLYNKGLIYRGKYIINWCPRCKTALSDEESIHKEIDGWLYYIRYPIIRAKEVKDLANDYIVVATTRPETMLGDTAIAVNPTDNRYKFLKDVKVILPIMNRELKVIEDELVDKEFGTGVVKVTPAHDPIDFILANKHNLEFINIMNDDGTLNENAGKFKGVDRFQARKEIIEVLEKDSLIEKKEPYWISVGHCYRCNTIVEPRLSLQWFVRMKPLAIPAIKVVEEGKIKFYPQRWEKVYLNWMYNIKDWCISRQIWWGHRLPVYYCKECYQEENSRERSKGVIVSVEEPKYCPDCGSKKILQDSDVLDTWFSSWLWPFATFYWPNPKRDLNYFYPTSVLVTASEILFFWVARMIMAGLEFTGNIPFSNVLIHGTVRDEKGTKMSKSLGNIIDPLEIIDKFGADALRFSLMFLASTGADVYLSDEKFLVGRNFANKIWNATRFIMNKLKDNDIKIEEDKVDITDEIDLWIIDSLNRTIEAVTVSLDSYRISEATKNIYDFFWHNFCDWYIEIAKLYLGSEKLKVLILCLINSLKLLHPFMPFITEKIYQDIKSYVTFLKDESISISLWPKKIVITADSDKFNFVEDLISSIEEIRNIKSDLGISATEKVKIFLNATENIRERFNYHKDWFMRLGGIREIDFVDNLEKVIISKNYFSLNIDFEHFDRDRLVKLLEKKLVNLRTLYEKVFNKLNNKEFLNNAPQEIVEREREKERYLSFQCKRLEKIKDVFK
ncbi:MAG: valine--tRNA ligase [Candidatus Omnitrophica bacterium]|nr:valine--tRNA ligase [Candidatus Omnitrophota bacterium]